MKKRVYQENQKVTWDKVIQQQEPYKDTRDRSWSEPEKKHKSMDQGTRKLMTMHKWLHPRDVIDRLYVSKKEEGRGLVTTEDSVD